MNNTKPTTETVEAAHRIMEQRQELFNEYGNHVFESFEQFCDRMADTHGLDWVNKLKRTKQ